MTAFTMNNVTIDRDEGMALSFVTIWHDKELLRKSYLTDDAAHEGARQLHAAQLLDHFFGSLALNMGTVELQSRCRGEVPTANRDYSAWYWPGMEQVVSPPDQGGKEAAANNGTRAVVAGSNGDRNDGHRAIISAKLSTKNHGENPHPAAWAALNKAIASGEAWTPPMIRVIENPLTDQPAINPRAIWMRVLDVFNEPVPSYRKRYVGDFKIQEGNGVNVVIFHKDRPKEFVIIGHWSLATNGYHRWHKHDDLKKRLDDLYARLGLPIVERVNEALPI